MTTAIRLAVACLILVLLLGLGAWYYLFGPNEVAAANLVPADTLVFATIPNAARVATDYQTSQLKKLADSPNAKPLIDQLSGLIGQKNLGLLQTFLPNLSGQSFVAVTHFDPAHPEQIGLISGLKPKPGVENFDEFIAKLKATYPELVAQGTTGAGQLQGLPYQWIQGPGGSDKICVARYRGWIVTAWGEGALRDWWERLQKRASTPSLAENPAYKKSLERVGKNSEAVLYLDFHALMGLLEKQMAVKQPGTANYFTSKYQAIGAAAVGTEFEHGEIADHFSMLIPRQAQIDLGSRATPCPFETLKFTGPDTRFYWASNPNFQLAWKNLQEQSNQSPPVNPLVADWMAGLQNWAQNHHLDLQRNIIGPLGSEVSVQLEWSDDSSYPEAGLFVKLDKPDDFKPTETAIIETIREAYVTSAAINEIESGGQHFATLKFIQSLPISPTMTEDGPYFGLFVTENQAVRSFQRDASVGLLNNPNFKNQIGDKRSTASQLVFLDSPQLLERGYQTTLPYVSLAAMFNRTLSAALQGRTLPSDAQWLAPIGTWSFTLSPDDDGITGYSVSGIGNQGIFLSGGAGAAMTLLPMIKTSLGMASPSFSPAPAPLTPAMPTASPVPPSPVNVTHAASAPTNATNVPSPVLPPTSNAIPPAPVSAPTQ